MRSGGDILSGFKVMFWGFLFFFDFRIQGFDVLPDIIGYWLIYTGAGDLIAHSTHFTMVKKFALPLTIVSLFDIYQIQKPIEHFSVDPLVVLFSFIGILITIVDLLLVFNLCYGVVEMARAVANPHLASNAEARWNYYLYAKVAFLILTPIGSILPPLVVIGFIPLFIISICVLALMMGLMKQADDIFNFESM